MAQSKLRRRRRTKIVATVGPASSTPEMLGRLFRGGADVFRLNFSHGSHEDHAARIAIIRALEEETGRPIGILADVQGPKLRVGRFQAGRVRCRPGRASASTCRRCPATRAGCSCRTRRSWRPPASAPRCCWMTASCACACPASATTTWRCEVVTGGPLSDRKGVNVPDVVLPIPALTKKDHEDLRFALDHGVDYIGLSFVQRPEDVAEARAIADGRAWIMTKLEKPQALDNLDGILALSDAVMVARGDLGVELPPEEVPLAQKRIVRAARQHGLPVVVATQMLESMISAPAPTRAEASRRGDRRVRRRGRGDAERRDRRRAVPLRGGEHDGPHHRPGGAGPGLARAVRDRPPAAGTHGRRRHRRRRPADRQDDRRQGHRRLHHVRLHRAARGARPGRTARCWA